MLVQFGNNWIQKIPQTAKLDEAVLHTEMMHQIIPSAVYVKVLK